MEDFNKLRLISRQLIRTEFRHGWQFRVETRARQTALMQPPDFDLYVKDITYDPIGIETESERIGGHNFVWPISTQLITITMTMRDNVDQRIRKWFQSLSDTLINKDGTINLLNQVEVYLEKYTLNSDGIEVGTHDGEWVIPTKLGEITESRDQPGFIEYPIVFMQHRTVPNP